VAACDGGVAVAYGQVFTSAADFTLLTLDATTGAQAWTSADRLNAAATPTVANHVLYAQTTDGFAAYRASDGARRLLVPRRGLDQPVVAHGFVYVGKVTASFEGSVLQVLHK
jgi:outer membrane protein assembly factor BamB